MELLPGQQKWAQYVERLYTEKLQMVILLNTSLSNGRSRPKSYKGKDMKEVAVGQ
jgi:hypothetical protein